MSEPGTAADAGLGGGGKAASALAPFRDRPLNDLELEVLRLVLSTFRDGTGQTIKNRPGTVPNSRDYERSLAAVLRARTPENKGVYDVVVDTAAGPFGISCKMVSEQPPASQCSFMELSNAAAAFRRHLLASQINWATEPGLAGPAIIDLVSSWHAAAARDLLIDASASRYSVLTHDRRWERFQLQCFPMDLRRARPVGDVAWRVEGRSLNGYIQDGAREHRLWQCFMNSGGQLKFYPLLSWAEWVSPAFSLETPPPGLLLRRAREYFHEVWPVEWLE